MKKLTQQQILGAIGAIIFLAIILISFGVFGKKSKIRFGLLIALIAVGTFAIARAIPGVGLKFQA